MNGSHETYKTNPVRVSLSLGLPRRMMCWLHDSHGTIVQNEYDMIPIDTGTEAHAVFVEEIEQLARKVQPFVMLAGVTTEAFYNDLLVHLSEEIRERSFQGVCRLRTLVTTRKKR